MSFFQKIYDVTDGIDITVTIKRKNGRLTMSVLPQTTATINSALITGTPEELEEGFFEAIKAPIETAKGLKADLEQFNTSVTVAKKAATEKPVAKSPATATDKKEPAKKSEKKTETTPEETLF